MPNTSNYHNGNEVKYHEPNRRTAANNYFIPKK